jgi:G3E family GTPase
VITTVDAVHGLRAPESVPQVAAADRLVVTKTDLADAAELERRLAELNPAAAVLEAAFGEVEPEALLGGEERRLPGLAAPDGAREHGDVVAHCLVFEEPLEWVAFGVWLTMLLAARGGDVLRVKGLLDVGAAGPLLLNGVQHVVHPPVHLAAWPDGDRRSRLVLIARGLERQALDRSLAAFLNLAHPWSNLQPGDLAAGP